MKPYYQDSLVTIYHGDNREILPSLGMFDLLLTDPPYGLGKKSNGGSWGNFGEWDEHAPDIVPFLTSAVRCIIWGGNYFMLPPSRLWLVWNKPERGLSMADAELAWCSFDGNARVFDSIRNPDGKRLHPTQKPIDLMAWCIGLSGNVKTILDPFAGSGTTGRAAKDLGKSCVLIEREERYCEIAARRMAQEILPLSVTGSHRREDFQQLEMAGGASCAA